MSRCAHLGGFVFVRPGDQRTPPDTEFVTQQLGHSSSPHQPRQVLLLPQVEDAPSRLSRFAALQEDRAGGPGLGVQVRHQPI